MPVTIDVEYCKSSEILMIPNRLYKFTPRENCSKCDELIEEAREAYSLEGIKIK